MSNCLRGKDAVKKTQARFQCLKCRALAEKKSQLCAPQRIEPPKKK